jgi:hypothetical protein|tara:strand:- start:1381 stop:1647 length:267 start_codon:yes stop_codon:yes gene_type:complete
MLLNLIVKKVPWGSILQGYGATVIFEEFLTNIGLADSSGDSGEVTLALSTATANDLEDLIKVTRANLKYNNVETSLYEPLNIDDTNSP